MEDDPSLLELLAAQVRQDSEDPGARYDQQGLLGRGGMGVVTVAKDNRLHRTVAVKYLQPGKSDKAAARFLREAKITALLDHPNIVPVYDLAVSSDGAAFFTMKAIEGRSLSEVLDQGELRRGVAQLELFKKVCDAVGYAHSKGVLHRDLKPSNVMVGAHGEVLVIDWGIAMLLGSHDDATLATNLEDSEAEQTQDGEVTGTPAYMAPEQARGERELVGPASDIYALGAMLYRMLTGQVPHRGAWVHHVLASAASGAFTRPRDVDPTIDRDLEAIICRAMALDPGDRYGSTEELKGDLERYQDGRPVAARRYGLAERVAMWTHRHRRVVTGLTAAGAVLGAMGLLGLGVYVRDVTAARDLAEESAAAARVAEHAARVAAADAKVGEGLAIARSGRVFDGRIRVLEGRDALAAIGESPLTAQIALTDLLRTTTHPRLVLTASGSVSRFAAFDATGEQLLWVAGGMALLSAIPSGALQLSSPLTATGQTQVAFVDGKPTAVVVRDDAVVLQDVEGGPIRELERDGTPVHRMVMSADGSHLALLAKPRQLEVYRLPGLQRLDVAIDDAAVLEGISNDGNRLLVRTNDLVRKETTPLLTRDRVSGAVLGAVPHYNGVPDATLSVYAAIAEDGAHLVSLLDAQAPVVQAKIDRFRWGGISSDGSFMWARDTGHRLRTWDRRGAGLILRSTVSTAMQPRPMALSADGHHAVTDWANPDQIAIWDLHRPEPDDPSIPISDEHGLVGIASGPEGEVLGVSNFGAQVHLVDRVLGTVLLTLDTPEVGSREVTIDADGRRIAVAGRDGVLREYALPSGAPLRQLDPPDGTLLTVSYLADGSLATGGDGTALHRYAGDTVRSTPTEGEGILWRLVQHPDGWIAATCRGNCPDLTIWDADGALLHAWPNDPPNTYALCLDPRSERHVYGSGGGELRTFAPDGMPAVPFHRVPGNAVACAWSPDGEILAVGGSDARVYLLDRDGTERISVESGVGLAMALEFVGDRVLAAAGSEGRVQILDLNLPGKLEALDAHQTERAGALCWHQRDWSCAVAEAPLDRARILFAKGDRRGARAALDEASGLAADLWRRFLQ
jgi:WD40 repeat protein/predicted Ser/Thr protein kinase